MRLPRKIAGLLMTAGMVVGITAAAAPAYAASTYYAISTTTPPGGTMCLEADPAPDFAYRVTTQTCDTASNQAQQWDIQVQGGGIVKLANRAISGWCIEANAIGNGSAVPLWPCSSTESNLRWAWHHDNNFGISVFESRISGSTGHCLDVPGGQTLKGLWMQVYSCNSTAAQTFLVSVAAHT